VERTYLTDHMIPRLQSLCHAHGLQLVVVDLYKYVPNEGAGGSSHDPEAIYQLESEGLLSLSKSEIRQCQTQSAGPTFLVSATPPCIAMPIPHRLC